MIITIGRQYGSGGREIGELLARRMGYAFYDKEILAMAAESSGFSAEAMQRYDEKPTGSLIYSLYMTGTATTDNLPLNQQLAFAQFNVVRKVAQGDNCVIVGRCADYVLRDKKNLLSVFLYAPMEHRIQRVMAEHAIDSEVLAEKAIKKQDKTRGEYYNFFTHRKWGAVENAMLSIDTSVMSTERIAEMIAAYARQFEQVM